MCAPKKIVPILAIGALALATGGIGAAAAGGATAGSSVAIAPGSAKFLAASSQASTLSSLTTALQVGLKYANTAAPLIGAVGSVYSGQVQKSIFEQQALATAYGAMQEEETYKLRRNQRKRELVRALGKQRALYGISGVSLADTPTDVFASTAKSFAEDDFYDRYGTAGKIASAGISADNLRLSGDAAELGGLLSANLTLARRGIV